jgi:hypothetical protein
MVELFASITSGVFIQRCGFKFGAWLDARVSFSRLPHFREDSPYSQLRGEAPPHLRGYKMRLEQRDE